MIETVEAALRLASMRRLFRDPSLQPYRALPANAHDWGQVLIFEG